MMSSMGLPDNQDQIFQSQLQTSEPIVAVAKKQKDPLKGNKAGRHNKKPLKPSKEAFEYDLDHRHAGPAMNYMLNGSEDEDNSPEKDLRGLGEELLGKERTKQVVNFCAKLKRWLCCRSSPKNDLGKKKKKKKMKKCCYSCCKRSSKK